MIEVFILIAELGLPIAGALIMGFFIFTILKQMMNELIDEVKTIKGITTVSYTHLTLPTICSV